MTRPFTNLAAILRDLEDTPGTIWHSKRLKDIKALSDSLVDDELSLIFTRIRLNDAFQHMDSQEAERCEIERALRERRQWGIWRRGGFGVDGSALVVRTDIQELEFERPPSTGVSSGKVLGIRAVESTGLRKPDLGVVTRFRADGTPIYTPPGSPKQSMMPLRPQRTVKPRLRIITRFPYVFPTFPQSEPRRVRAPRPMRSRPAMDMQSLVRQAFEEASNMGRLNSQTASITSGSNSHGNGTDDISPLLSRFPITADRAENATVVAGMAEKGESDCAGMRRKRKRKREESREEEKANERGK
jgi:hypothetical protein